MTNSAAAAAAATSNTNDPSSPLAASLQHHILSATVKDVDHHRIRGGMAVETEYIIQVVQVGQPPPHGAVLEPFRISKTYNAFRTLVSQLRKAVNLSTNHSNHNHTNSKQQHRKNPSLDSLPKGSRSVVLFTEKLTHLIEAEPVVYIGKVNFMYVKSLAKHRRERINNVLEWMLQSFPSDVEDSNDTSLKILLQIMETFFLTDYCVEEEDEVATERHINSVNTSAIPNKDVVVTRVHSTTPVVPLTRRHRPSIVVRKKDEALMEDVQESFVLDDERKLDLLFPSYSEPPQSTKIPNYVDPFGSIFSFSLLFSVGVGVFYTASLSNITIDGDVALLCMFVAFCLGIHMPRYPSVMDKPLSTSISARLPLVTFQEKHRVDRRSMVQNDAGALLRLSLARPASRSLTKKESMTMEEDEIVDELAPPHAPEPMKMYPKGEKLGEHFNCWSTPLYSDFNVRGSLYLKDKKKVSSGPYLFPMRGVDLFLTDDCPANVGRHPLMFGGRLREVSTFILNFRLPWGVLVFYSEIPSKFLPFLRYGYETPNKKSGRQPSMENMTPGERALCLFLMGDDDYKNERLKIVPNVIEGPWVVKTVVGGKPAIIGKKMPVTYVYQPAEGTQAAYLEADFDIVASSAARKILSVVRSYTSILTLDLGFVIQSNKTDELPEQMLVAPRMHGIDPFSAPSFPQSNNMLESYDEGSTCSVNSS
uniref:Protein ENHANCED DISEASE RESISTANCE 2 C-terminal domain-containing protein n=1 Tax=Attheya septentrionalis TaxID=420275 RepID=A0A7S2URM0_9STRA|mmetsp:Transcript_6458/g.11518  ORF Transcript_6458/g.11518 Transcript_6458/m.11518 type:complete len:704 (+) Transcript_6458:87-2198(+)